MKNIKNFLLIVATSYICTTTNLYAARTSSPLYQAQSGFYLGVDAIQSRANHSYLTSSTTRSGEQVTVNGHHSRGNDTGFGGNFGYKITLQKAFISPEIFYDQINNSTSDFSSTQFPATPGDSLNVDNRYGAKINFGYNIFSKFNIFTNVGAANVRHKIDLSSSIKKSRGANALAMIYGGGISYDLSNHWLLKVSYDWQQFIVRYDLAPETDRITLQTARFGVAYKF